MEYPSYSTSIDEACDTVNETVIAHKLSPPPILIAHSMSTFIAQKYLESYPASGIILVNPLPVNCSTVLQTLTQRWKDIDILRRYAMCRYTVVSPREEAVQIWREAIREYYGLRLRPQLPVYVGMYGVLLIVM